MSGIGDVDVGNLDVDRAGRPVAERGSEGAERGSEVAERGSEVAERGSELAERASEGAERAAAGAALAAGRRVVAAGHLPLDGDGLGSALGLMHALRASGREAVVLLGEEPPRNLRFLPGVDDAVRHPDALPFVPDLFVALDGGGADRFGDMLPTDGTPVLNIDHHVTNERFGTLDWVDPGSAATGLMVYELLRDLGLSIDLPTAECLYTTLVTDTGRFSYSNTSPRAHEAAADLLRHGVQPDRVLLHVFRSRTAGQLGLASDALGRLQTSAGGRLAWTEVTLDMCRERGVTPEEAHDLIDYPMSLEGVEFGILFREQERDEPTTHVSLRSNGGVDVSRFAIERGGGGHPRAAGFSTATPLALLRPAVVAAAEAVLENGE